MQKLLITLCFIIICLKSESQTYLYFQDSDNPAYYDFSWMELTAPSDLERKGAELRNFPVELGVAAHQGNNSLRLHWCSKTGGDWVAIAAGKNWTAKNIANCDTLSFWAYSFEGITSANLPKVFMEDVNNVKTSKISLSGFSSGVAASSWAQIKIPMSAFKTSSPSVNFTQIKTVGFAQSAADAVYHILLVDDVKVYTGTGTSAPISQPTGLSAKGYDSHVELRWNKNPEAECSGYEIYQSKDNGTSFQHRATVEQSETFYCDFTGAQGSNLNLIYRLTALNQANEPSAFSLPVNAQTQIFSDEQLLNMVQEATFRFFWDYAHPVSGLARERLGSGDVVTTGGSGFGIMCILSGINQGFITREQGAERMLKIVNFLATADRFHGVWSHWLNGSTGRVIPFSTYDNGGDLIETGFMIQGLLAARKYFEQSNSTEQQIVQKITTLWESVEWDWYSRNNSGKLYWHWSPQYNWQMNMPVLGWNEGLIIYLLAIASPTHSVPASYWTSGWTSASYYVNGGTFYGYPLQVGWDNGGPLFFAHYSFLGFDARHKKDQFANYFINNTNHTLINRAYCIANPKHYAGYSANCWGLTASDDPYGYSAHEPTNSRDNGTITPTAALSSIVYTPEFSIDALKHFYRQKGANLWGQYGFVDAFNEQTGWYANSYLAIDQGPIMVMIENYRSGLIWDRFMSNLEIQNALQAIGFTEDPIGMETVKNQDFNVQIQNFSSEIKFTIQNFSNESFSAQIYNVEGKLVVTLCNNQNGNCPIFAKQISTNNLHDGMYVLKIFSQKSSFSKKFILSK